MDIAAVTQFDAVEIAALPSLLLRDLGELSGEISEVDVEAAGELRVVLRGAGEVLRMGGPPYRGKLQTYMELRDDLQRRCPDAEYFDLRFQDRVIVKEPPAALPVPSSEAPRKAGPAGPAVQRSSFQEAGPGILNEGPTTPVRGAETPDGGPPGQGGPPSADAHDPSG